MEVLDSNAGELTNFEVLALLKTEALQRYDHGDYKATLQKLNATIAAGNTLRGKLFSELSDEDKERGRATAIAHKKLADVRRTEGTCWVRRQVLEYLSDTPAGLQETVHLQKFLTKLPSVLGTAALSKSEVRQLLNLRPNTTVEIHRVVEECEDRLNEEQIQGLLDLVQECLPAPVVLQAEEGDVDDAEGDVDDEEGDVDDANEGEGEADVNEDDAMGLVATEGVEEEDDELVAEEGYKAPADSVDHCDEEEM